MILIGYILISIGLLLRFWSMFCLKDCFSWRVTQPNRIIDIGPYKYIRHPMYAGALFLYFGLFLIFSDLRMAILMNIFTINFIVDRIDREEQIMVLKFGQSYIDYMNRTKIIIPFIW